MLSRFKSLNKGVLRIIWTVSVLAAGIPFLASLVWVFDDWRKLTLQGTEGYLLAIFVPLGFLIGPFLFVWIVARLVIWIVDGFSESRTARKEDGLDG